MQNQIESPTTTRAEGRPPVVVQPPVTATYSYRAVGAIWLVGGIIAAIIAIRFVLELLGASLSASFTTFMYGITDPFVAPFQGIFPTPMRHGFVFEGAALLAIVIYLLITWGAVTLVKILSTSRRARTPVD